MQFVRFALLISQSTKSYDDIKWTSRKRHSVSIPQLFKLYALSLEVVLVVQLALDAQLGVVARFPLASLKARLCRLLHAALNELVLGAERVGGHLVLVPFTFLILAVCASSAIVRVATHVDAIDAASELINFVVVIIVIIVLSVAEVAAQLVRREDGELEQTITIRLINTFDTKAIEAARIATYIVDALAVLLAETAGSDFIIQTTFGVGNNVVESRNAL